MAIEEARGYTDVHRKIIEMHEIAGRIYRENMAGESGATARSYLASRGVTPGLAAEFEIRFGSGVDTMSELIDLGIARGLIDKSGNHLSFAGAALGNGRERSRDTLSHSVELQSTLRQAIIATGPVRPGRRQEADA